MIRTLAYQLIQSNTPFAEELAARIDDSPKILKSSLDEQFRCLLQEPLATIAANHDLGPIVIVLDALDECGTSNTRKKLLDTLCMYFARLPSIFRILIASRDEPDIRAALSRPGIALRDVMIEDQSTTSDISQFFRYYLAGGARAFRASGLAHDWPGDSIRQQLVTLSGGLFIWASTTVRFIESGFPEERLEMVLGTSTRAQSHDRLDNLYRVALGHPFDSYHAEELEAVHSVLGAIVVAREQLTDEQLSQLLDLKMSVVREVLSRLQPLLQGGQGKPVQVLHTSFTDFLRDPERCQTQWHINVSAHHLNLLSGCLRLMQRDLKFNICGIETSDCPHAEIKGIQARIDKAVTPVLMYASQYWADHLQLGSSTESASHQLGEEVMDFMKDRFLYWIEVFSLKSQVSMISGILRNLTNWANVG